MARSRFQQPPQLGLFEGRLPGGFAGGRRLALDATSWVDYFPGWLPDAGSLYAALEDHAGWEQRSRWMYAETVTEPRLTAEYAAIAEAPIPELQRVTADISHHYGVVYDSAWLNLYRSHEDSTGWHADRPVQRLEAAIVPVLSLGGTRRFLVRPRGGGRSVTLRVETGDLVVMGGRCQRDWEHSVPKEAHRTGARISVNFGSSAQRGADPLVPAVPGT